ncbi:hydrogenase maturation protease [Mariprofundus ferrinatatus]|uniref:Hydrogenase maturation protease n=1 Tax=Mariprofundus ferrinatatus TaxID=1921087 RepID=A0A2K8L5E9_9PROT|nr:hydrogenase maturation protease [Mariprofundus ferrinatatus]ATX82540.1 hydrogenase maturation protease [Mariprofundus ferrinatatus]
MNILIFGYGNPGRGDDALGPELVAAIQAENIPGIECQDDMQLQVEHVTDLTGRDAILFIDADASCVAPFHFSEISAEKDDSYTSHAMTPHALLHAFHTVYGKDAPPAFLMRIRGYQFELGEALSSDASENLEAASLFIRNLCKSPYAESWRSLHRG